MDGGANNGDLLMRRQSKKRNFSTMSSSHQDSSLPGSHDFHYDDEHASRRQRIRTELPHLHRHYPGDGLDFRRPVMSTSAAPSSDHERDTARMQSNSTVIDLTGDGGMQGRSRESERRDASTAAQVGATRAHRLPRFGRDVIEVDSSGEEDDTDLSNLPGSEYLALPHRRPRPQYSVLRRPARPPSPPTDMEDVEFLEERPRSRPRHESQRRSPVPQPRVRHGRSATPYPVSVNEPIDLTEDNDDDILHLETRQREGVNNARPDDMTGAGTRTLADRSYANMGNIANMLREGGANIGNRLRQRLEDYAGIGRDARAQQQQALRQLRLDHELQYADQIRRELVAQRAAAEARPRPRQHHHHHHHGHRHRHVAAVANRAPQGIRILQEMPGMMDYGMTAFDIGGRGDNRPPTPKYSPPAAPEKGFTRGPEEDEVVVCPNCGDELAVMGGDTKQEVWVIKSCGHAYCGDCAHNRSRPQKNKGKGKAPAFEDPSLAPTFKKCVIDGCGKPTSSKNSMVRVYWGG